LPLAMVRADAADPRPGTQQRLLVRAAVAQCAEGEALVLDAGFGLALLQEEGATRYVVRCAKNSTFRRATAPPYGGRGRPATRGATVRPLPRAYKGRAIPATPPDRTETWQEDGVTLRADGWTDLVLPPRSPCSPGRSSPMGRRRPRPSRRASGTAAPSRRRAACGVPWRAVHFRMMSRSRPESAQKRRAPTICPRASGANGGGAAPCQS